MAAVLVHEVPEPPAVWHGLLAALDRPDTVALSLPGFDSARPAGFGATMEEYAGWLAAQPEVTDAAGIGDVEFEWHSRKRAEGRAVTARRRPSSVSQEA